MKCAVCGDFLITGQGFQCSLCKYTCHKDCNSQVVIKCITKAKEEVEEEDLKMVRHRIPHRFESCNNLAANWCAHCGSMIALGKKQSVKCTECNIMAHKNCSHLVPNFCGLSSELINQMLKAINTAEQVKKVKDSVVVAPKKDSEVRASVPAHRGSLITPPVFDTTSQNIPKNVGLNDFIFLAVLGKGNFGKVELI